MTVLQIKNGIVAKLDAAYSGRPIYGEEIRQGFKAPCFFVQALDSSTKREINRRRRRSADFVVQYFPDAAAKQNDALYARGEELLELLEYITADGGELRASNARYEVVDGVLHFFMSFSWMAFADAEDVTAIEKIDLEVS